MANRSIKGGGFFRGVIYGLVLSTVIFLGLSVVFPLQEEAPIAAMDNPVQTAPQAFDVGPGSTDDSGISVGGDSDSVPNVGASAQLDTSAPIAQPVVATQSADVPDIGDGSENAVEANPVVTPVPEPAPAVVAPEPEIAAAPEVAPTLPDADSGEAFDVFSVPFTRDIDLPMLAIVFEDTLEASLQRLFDANIPLNFAVAGTNLDPQISRGFRENGFEVLTLLPNDMVIDATLSEKINGFISNVPASIGVIDSTSNGVMNDSRATQIMIETAAVNGIGTIAFAGAGDQNAGNLAKFYGKPFGSVHRIIDENPDVAAIKSALDRATLTAQTSGSAIIYARTRETTIQALLEWLASSGAERVQIVPVSQIMRAN